MNKDELLKLRGEIIGNSLPSMLEQLDDKESQFNMTLRVIQTGSVRSNDIYDKAYKLANEIEDQPAKVDALMRLLDEIDIELTNQGVTAESVAAESEGAPAAEATVEAPKSAPLVEDVVGPDADAGGDADEFGVPEL